MNNPVSSSETAAPASPFLLEARALHKSYSIGRRTLEVLRGVSVSVARGEFLALRGASGAGKSTLLHLLGGLDTPNQGEIFSAGTNLASLSSLALSRWRNHKVGFIFQAYHLLPELDALENVCLLIHKQISTKYAQRADSYAEIAAAIESICATHAGNSTRAIAGRSPGAATFT